MGCPDPRRHPDQQRHDQRYAECAGCHAVFDRSTRPVGKPDWDLPCVGLFACSESNTSYNRYTGGMFNPHLGAELGHVNFGRFHRADGRTQAHGATLSLLGQVPLGGLNLYAVRATDAGRARGAQLAGRTTMLF